MHFAFSRNFCFIKYTSESGAGYFLPSSTSSAQALCGYSVYVQTKLASRRPEILQDLSVVAKSQSKAWNSAAVPHSFKYSKAMLPLSTWDCQ